MPNRLIHQKSPYLQMHAENPVDWYPWGEEAFELAKKRDVPVFLSIGYSSCHWCHVMEEESFKDIAAAKMLNENFVSVKVDREELAAVDNFYMEACRVYTGSGGWPLSAFLLHDKTPFFAGTYFPRESKYGIITFKDLLTNIISAWKNNKEKLAHTGKHLLEHIAKDYSGEKSQNQISFDNIYKKIESVSDKKYGGYEGAPKFPSASMLMFLLQYGKYKPGSGAHKILHLTLSSMECGGIYDHIGGGFFRYSTDGKWLVPHFEKMLYDNALLIYIYAAASVCIDKKYEHTARKTANYLLSEMLSESGGFYTAEDADSENTEGKFYVFSPEEIIKQLGQAEGEKFCEDYDITQKGNFKGLSIPNRIGKKIIYDDKRCEEIYRYRAKRIKPFKDKKIITSSNGLAVAAFALGGRLLKEEGWIKQAEKTADFMLENLFSDGRLMARHIEGETAFKGTADDYGCLLWGLSELYQSTLNVKWLSAAQDIALSAALLFKENGEGFYYSGKDDQTVPVRLKKLFDGPVPSANGLLADCYINLYTHTGNDIFKDCYNSIFEQSQSMLIKAPAGCLGIVNSLMKEQMLAHIILTEGKGFDEFFTELTTKYYPFALYTLHNEDFKNHFQKAVNAEEEAAAHICDKSGCHPPVYESLKVFDILNKCEYNISLN